MRKIRVTVTDEVKSNSALCRVTPSVINLGGIAGEHNATRIVYVLPDSWDTDTGSFFVECESNNGEAALSDELFVTEENGEKQIYFDIPYGMTAAGTAEFTLKHNFYAEDNKTLEKSVRSAKLRVRFPDSTEVSAENRKLAEDLLGGMSAQINDLLKRFYDGEFNGKDGMPGEKGDKGDAGTGLEELRALLEQSESNNSLFYNERNNLVPEDSGGNLYIPFQEILQNFPAEDFSFYSNVSYNGTYLWGVNHEFYHEDSKAVLLVFVDEYTANGDNVKNTNMVFVNGEFNTADSYVEELIDGEMAYSPLAEPIEYFKLPVFDKFESDYSDTDITLFYSPLRIVSALADAIKKAHVHLNLKTLSKFYCDTAEAESNDGLPPILPDHIGADRIKYNGIYLRYCSDGGVIVDGTEVTDPETGEKVFRVDLDNGPLVTGKKLAFFDIPITGTKEVTKESPEPGVGTQSVGLQLQLGGVGGSATVDPTLTVEGEAADAKVTGDRLNDIEYQTVTTELEQIHTDLPIGEKTVTVQGDGTWGDTVYVSSGVDLVPRKTFNRKFPYNGITVEKNGYTYHLSGTATATTSIHFTNIENSAINDFSKDLANKTLRFVGFSDAVLGEKVRIFVQFYDENKKAVSGQIKNAPFKNSPIGTSEITVPENTAYIEIYFYISSGTVLDNDIQVYLNLAEKTQASTKFENIAVNDNESTYVMSFPYESVVSIEAPIGEYIKYKTANAKGDTATYLTPEVFGAVGDGYTNDTEAVNACIAKAAETNQTVLMAKKYYITSPIDILYDDMQIIINSVVYNGTESAVKIHGLRNTIKIQSVVSSSVGVAFVGENEKHITHNALEINTIDSKSHGITFTTGSVGLYQNTVRFNNIKAGGADCYGIAYFNPSDIGSFGEDNFYGGQISNCEWACYGTRGNSKFYGIEIEGNVQGGFYIYGHTQIFHPRITESQRDGNLPIYKFIKTDYTTIYDSTGISINQIDLSEAVDTETNGNPLSENKISKINGTIHARIPTTGENAIGVTYCREAYVWGKYLIMQPHMAYRKEVTTAELDTRLLGKEAADEDSKIHSLSQLPTKFVVNTVNTDIYLHESYCAFGFNEFEVEQANGFTCKVYDKLNNLIFDGTEQGDGLYKLNVYKDATYCAEHTSGRLRTDFLGHYWSVTKIADADSIWTAINSISGGINEIEAMIDESGVLE